jgi:hypothetical protein
MRGLRQTAKVFYVFRPLREGQAPMTDMRLPGGLRVCRVDEAVHRKALSNAAKALKERFGS